MPTMLMAAPLTEKDKNAIRNILFNAEQQTGQRVIDLLEEGGAGIDSIVGGNAIAVDNSDPQNPIINALVPPLPLGNGLLSGGRVTWIQNYDYEVSAAVYVIDGVLYQTLNYPAPIAITLTPADPLLDRIDTFALTTSNTAIAITGTPSAPPVLEPDVDVTTQLRIAFALVTANTTQPTPSLPTESIYLENTEWVTSVSAGTWNPNSTNNPYAGTKDIEGTAVAANQSITFTPALFPSLILLDSLIFKIRSKATCNNPSRLVFQFRNGNVNVGVAVQLNNNAFGFNSSDILNYQNINIDLALFGNIAAATNLRVTKLGSGTIGFYLDNIQMVGNNNVVIIPSTLPYKVYTALLNQRTQDSGLLTVGVEYTITSYNAGDDFINVGALANVTGEVFVATGTTPTNWTNGSSLTNNQPPTVTILQNTLGNLVWTRTGTGSYAATLANAFAQIKTWHHISQIDSINYISFWQDVNTVIFATSIPTIQGAFNTPVISVTTDGYLYDTPIEIRVYP